ncbi:MAG TPA: hypothetical protein VGI45_18380 [Terracidiphilus sp.]
MLLLTPGFGSAQTSMQAQSDVPSQAGQEQAAQMVPAQAYLLNKLSAKDTKPGSQFTARLSETVHLKNGPELPKGTELIGTVSTDDMQIKGASKLALRIAEARLKNGKTIPVKATIVGLYAPETETINGNNVAPGEEESNDWKSSVLNVDQLNAAGGFDLHSRVNGNNSGVLVSTKKNNVKIASGSELALAIAAQSSAEQTGAGGGN